MTTLGIRLSPATIAEDFEAFEMKEAYIDGAKAALSGIAPGNNPFIDGTARAHWIRGHSSVLSEPICTV
jgi:hypothetical protein